MQQSNTNMKDLPLPDMSTRNTRLSRTNTSENKEHLIKDPKVSIPISESLVPDFEDLDTLTPKQERIRKLLQQRYVEFGGFLTLADSYAGMVVMKCSEER